MDEDKFLGPCKVCEEAGRKREDGGPNRLRIIQLKGGKRMYGCEGWIRPPEGSDPKNPPPNPDSCPVSGPLPGRGYELWRLEERCSVCERAPRLTVKGFRGRPWKLCLNDDCPTMVEMREKRAERQAAKEAREEAKAADGEGRRRGATARAAPAKRAADGPRARRRRKPSPQTARTKKPAPAGPSSAPLRTRCPARLSAACSSRSRGSTAPGRRTQAALLAEALGPETAAAARARRHRDGRAGPDAAEGPRAGARPRRRAAALLRRPGRAVRPRDRGPRSRRAPTSSATGSSTPPPPTRAPRAALGIELVEGLNAIAIGDCTPDLTVLLRVDPGEAEAAASSGWRPATRTGRTASRPRASSFQRRVAAGLRRARRPPPRPDRR